MPLGIEDRRRRPLGMSLSLPAVPWGHMSFLIGIYLVSLEVPGCLNRMGPSFCSF